MRWQPSIGAWPEAEGTRFRVWAPTAKRVELVLDRTPDRPVSLDQAADGFFSTWLKEVRGGDRYRYRVDGQGPFPDPASRFQPEGVHGPSEVVDAASFRWTDTSWKGCDPDRLVIYELHVGTFTPAGNYAGVTEKLPYLADLGVTAIELMPLADYPGTRNWGYDGVSLFAPPRCYGRPDDLRRMVNEAHRLGLAVLVDGVYNHLGPDGNYLGAFSPFYFSKAHHTDWGAALNFDGEQSSPVRQFYLDNALHWVHEYHVDGLRLDATHAIIDNSPRHILQEITEAVHSAGPAQRRVVIAEDDRNLDRLIRPAAQGGLGLDGVWADDFHHQVRRLLAGDCESYYRSYTGTSADLAETIRQGWFFCGQVAKHHGKPRGTDPAGIPPRRFVVCIQNHDQIGNRALGERLHHQIEPAVYRAATALLLTVPQTPLLFMGQEWAASSPFQFFTDHPEPLGRLVTEGRRQEFRHFSAFTDPATRERIPDPQAEATVQASGLKWVETTRPPHAGCLALYRKLLQLRATEPALAATGREEYFARDAGEGVVLLQRRAAAGPALVIVVQLKGGGRVEWGSVASGGHGWEMIFSSEDAAFCPDPQPPRLDMDRLAIAFERPGAVILRGA